MNEKKPILAVEDCLATQLLIRSALEDVYQVEFASSGEEAITKAKKQDFALFILDIGLPDRDGYGVCVELRQTYADPSTPIIFLSSRNESFDKIKGFSLGADDYVVKPFHPLELRARAQCRLKENERLSSDQLVIGNLHIDVATHRVIDSAQPEAEKVELTSLEFRLLLFFAKRPDRVLTRSQILDGLWQENGNVGERTIDVHLSHLRKKLPSFSQGLKAIHGIGYRYQPITAS